MAFKLVSFVSFISIACKVGVFSQLIPLKYTKPTEDAELTYPGLAEKYGHPAITHEIITEDGYILTGYQIPGNVSRTVLLVHGNTPTSDCWILRGYGSLAITLANLGFEVWAINLRGNRYSQKHVTLDPVTQPREFYNFTFYEQAVKDMPATIDYILNKTGQESLIGIGHSVGTTQFYVLGAEKPEYNKKIKLAISLAPISFLQNGQSLPLLIKILPIDVVPLIISLKIYVIATHDGLGALARLACSQPLGYELCVKGFAFPLLGYDPDGFEPEFVTTLLGHFPGGTSTKCLEHLVQIIRSEKFAKYDYGEEGNLREYGSADAPEFDLSKVTMDSALFVGENDLWATVKDAELLNASLPNVVHYQVLPYKKFNHFDFVYGQHMNENFHPYLLKILKKYV